MEKLGLSQEGLKVITCVTMLIDHIGAVQNCRCAAGGGVWTDPGAALAQRLLGVLLVLPHPPDVSLLADMNFLCGPKKFSGRKSVFGF